MNTTNEQELREQLAAIEHERWADWQKYCHRVLRDNNPSPEQGDILERWDRQIETPYADLTELEKQSDREQVDRYWHLIQAHTNAEIARTLDRLESEKKIYVKHAEYVTELNEPPLVITTDYKYMVDLDAIQAERAKLKERDDE